MKKITLFSMVLIGAFMSCKKSNSGSTGYHMTASVDGASKNFNVTPPIAAESKSGTTVNALIITGVLNTSTGESMILMINSNDGSNIVPGTYADTSSHFNTQATYTVNLATQYLAGSLIAEEASGAGAPVKNHLKIVIASMDATSVKGTFSGDLYANGDVSTIPKPMTNGDFYAKFQ